MAGPGVITRVLTEYAGRVRVQEGDAMMRANLGMMWLLLGKTEEATDGFSSFQKDHGLANTLSFAQ